MKLAPAANADVVGDALDKVRAIAADAVAPPATALLCAEAAAALAAKCEGAGLTDNGNVVDGVYRALLRVAADPGADDADALRGFRSAACPRGAVATATRAALLRRALLVALHRDAAGSGAAFVAAARKAAARDAALDCLLEDDEARGPHASRGAYRPAADACDAANALGTPCWELVALARHCDPRVAAQATAALRNDRPGPRDDPDALREIARVVVPEAAAARGVGGGGKKKRKRARG